MPNAWAIARRELSASFTQPAAWVFLAGFLALASALGLAGFFVRDVSDLRDYFAGLRWAFALLGPALAMRLWAEERRLGTIELLLSLPITPAEAVLGKFLGGVGLLAAALALGSCFPISLLPFGQFDAGQLLAGTLGAFLLGCTFLAVGCVASAVSESQVVAFVLGALGCLALGALSEPVLLQQLERALPPAWVAGVSLLGVGEHYQAVVRGVLDTRDLVYFAATTALLLFWNVLLVERRERSPGEPWLAAALAFLCLWLTLDLQGFAHARLDLTVSRRNSLAPETRQVLSGVEQLLTIRAYFSRRLPEATRPQVRQALDLLEELTQALGSRARLEQLDPDGANLDPVESARLEAQAEREGITRFELSVLEADRTETVRVYAGISLHYGDRPPAVIPFALERQNLEYDLAVALQRLVLPRLRVGIAGEGTSSYQQARAALRQGYGLQELDLEAMAEVPPEVALLIYAAPVPPSERAVYLLDRYLARGGRLLLLAESHWVDHQGFAAHPLGESPLSRALARWGLQLEPALLAAPAQRVWSLSAEGTRYLAPYPWYLTPGEEGSPAAHGLGQLLFLLASPVVPAPDLPPGLAPTPLVLAPPSQAFPGEVDVHPARPPGLDELQGGRWLAAALRGRLPGLWTGAAAAPPQPAGAAPLAAPLAAAEGEALLIVVGDTDFLRDGNQAQGPGVALLLNLVDQALERSLTGIRGREAPPPLDPERRFVLGLPRETLLGLLDLGLLPGAVLLGGLLGVALRRRGGARRAAALRDARSAGLGPQGAAP